MPFWDDWSLAEKVVAGAGAVAVVGGGAAIAIKKSSAAAKSRILIMPGVVLGTKGSGSTMQVLTLGTAKRNAANQEFYTLSVPAVVTTVGVRLPAGADWGNQTITPPMIYDPNVVQLSGNMTLHPSPLTDGQLLTVTNSQVLVDGSIEWIFKVDGSLVTKKSQPGWTMTYQGVVGGAVTAITAVVNLSPV